MDGVSDMRAVHSITVTALTTIENSPVPVDTYRCTIETSGDIPLVTLIAAQGWFADRDISQEDLTMEMAKRLDAKVTTVAYRMGVKSEVVAG